MQQKENTVPIIEPVARELLLAELTPARKMRNTHRAGNEIYIFSAAECPSLMREVGRLREVAFRGAGATAILLAVQCLTSVCMRFRLFVCL